MNKLIEPISNKDFDDEVVIKFDNISCGFSKFKNSILKGDEKSFEEDYINFVTEIYNLNTKENFIVDFYYETLLDEQKQALITLLDDEDKKTLESLKCLLSKETVYYKIDKKLIPFIVRLTVREILFSTIYLTKYQYTIWGNYNNRFPVFYLDESCKEVYSKIAKKNNLEIE